MDRVDKRILGLLQRDASITNLELAEQVGLSPTPCARRVKALYDQGLIERQVCLLNRRELGLGLIVFIQVSLDRHTREAFAVFEESLAHHEEVVECNLITGQSADYLIKLVVPDLDYFQQFLLNYITEIKGVKEVQSSFVLNSPIQSTRLPLKHLR